MKTHTDMLREIADFLGHVAINGADTKDREVALALEQDARALAQKPARTVGEAKPLHEDEAAVEAAAIAARETSINELTGRRMPSWLATAERGRNNWRAQARAALKAAVATRAEQEGGGA